MDLSGVHWPNEVCPLMEDHWSDIDCQFKEHQDSERNIQVDADYSERHRKQKESSPAAGHMVQPNENGQNEQNDNAPFYFLKSVALTKLVENLIFTWALLAKLKAKLI